MMLKEKNYSFKFTVMYWSGDRCLSDFMLGIKSCSWCFPIAFHLANSAWDLPLYHTGLTDGLRLRWSGRFSHLCRELPKPSLRDRWVLGHLQTCGPSCLLTQFGHKANSNGLSGSKLLAFPNYWDHCAAGNTQRFKKGLYAQSDHHRSTASSLDFMVRSDQFEIHL